VGCGEIVAELPHEKVHFTSSPSSALLRLCCHDAAPIYYRYSRAATPGARQSQVRQMRASCGGTCTPNTSSQEVPNFPKGRSLKPAQSKSSQRCAAANALAQMIIHCDLFGCGIAHDSRAWFPRSTLSLVSSPRLHRHFRRSAPPHSRLVPIGLLAFRAANRPSSHPLNPSIPAPQAFADKVFWYRHCARNHSNFSMPVKLFSM
jgi:hypothetical protein